MKRSIDEFLVIYLQEPAFQAAETAKQALDVRKKADHEAAVKKRTNSNAGGKKQRPSGAAAGRRGTGGRSRDSNCPMSRAVVERGEELFRDYVDDYFTANDVSPTPSCCPLYFSNPTVLSDAQNRSHSHTPLPLRWIGRRP
jgi:hypothetical protein